MNKFLNKFFSVLAIPARIIFLVGSFTYVTWYAISSASNISGSFMPVLVSLILLFVGVALLLITPILVLVKKDQVAKIVFLLLLGYWFLTKIEGLYTLSVVFTGFVEDAGAVTQGILSFLTASLLLSVLVIVALEFALKKPILRLIALIVFVVFIFFSCLTGLFAFINAIRWQSEWKAYVSPFMEYTLLPLVVCFGYLYFSGAPKADE